MEKAYELQDDMSCIGKIMLHKILQSVLYIQSMQMTPLKIIYRPTIEHCSKTVAFIAYHRAPSVVSHLLNKFYHIYAFALATAITKILIRSVSLHTFL